MRRLLLCLASLYFVTAQNGPTVFVTSPNLVRVGNEETVLVNVFQTGQVTVTLNLKNTDTLEVIHTIQVQVSPGAPEIATFFVDPELVPKDDGTKNYIVLEAVCDEISFSSSEQLLLSYQAGYVFIQTDKPIYTPNQDVKIRVVVLDQEMHPSDREIRLEVLTPQNVIVKRDERLTTQNGLITKIFKFPTYPMFGNWSIMAFYGSGLSVNTSVQFEVKEYVLPTFSVEVSPIKPYVLPTATQIEGLITAKYVYNKPVRGGYNVKVGIVEEDGSITDLGVELSDTLTERGQGFFVLSTRRLMHDWFNEYEGKRLYLGITVVERVTGMIENASDTSAVFATSPYKFKWDRTVRYFKKGLPYEVKTDVLYQNNKPADNVDVSVIATAILPRGQEQLLLSERDENGNNHPTLAQTNRKGQVNFRLDIPPNADRLKIRLTTEDGALLAANNAEMEFFVEAYDSPSGENFLLIRLNTVEVQVGNSVNAEALTSGSEVVPNLNYFVIAKGKIIHKASTVRRMGSIHQLHFPVTYDMIPSARIVAYYINQVGQVVADSLWMEVAKRCENNVILSIVGVERGETLEPNENIQIQVDAHPDTTVGLVAVDQAVYLLRDYHRLTKDKMYSRMDSYDGGCGPGGGQSTPSVFKEAGVAVITNADLTVDKREGAGCINAVRARRKRDLAAQLEEFLSGSAERWICAKGHTVRQRLTCEQRLARIQNQRMTENKGWTYTAELGAIFLRCCEDAIAGPTDQLRGRSGGSSFNFEDFDLIVEEVSDIHLRSDFRETWIFQEVVVGDQGFAVFPLSIPGSITDWSIQAVGLSDEYAMCIPDPYTLSVTQDLFIQLHLPYSVVRLEQVEILASIFNYKSNNLAVRVYLQTDTELCSEGTGNNPGPPREIIVPGNDAMSLKYVVVPIEVGEFGITVTVYSINGRDSIMKTLRVVPEGVERVFTHSSVLDPLGTQRVLPTIQARANLQTQALANGRVRQSVIVNVENRHQLNLFDIRLPPNVVPGSESCGISVIGNMMGPIITSVIGGLDNLLRLPRGCGEQTMIYMAPNVYVLRYLKNTNTMNPQIEETAREFIVEGIVREMTHRHSDGSFSVWGNNPNYPSSTWLTSFVTKVFCHAKEFAFVDQQVTCAAIEWLIGQQNEDGAFAEAYRVHHREMTGGVAGDASLTAFVLISILECECEESQAAINTAKANAISYLEAQLPNLQRPYSLAIVSYALALAGSSQANAANNRLKAISSFDENSGTRSWGTDASSFGDSMRPYWYTVKPDAISVETTGYALLTQLTHGDITYSHAIVQWLTAQQNYGGGFISTQDTTIALQALSEYAILGENNEIDMTCTIRHDVERDFEHIIRLTADNALVQRHTQPPAVRGNLIIETEGQGVGHLNVEVKYNVPSTTDEICSFNLFINSHEARTAGIQPDLVGQNVPGGNGVGRSRIAPIWKRQANRSPVHERSRNFILTVDVRTSYLKNGHTGMSILDVGIYSGFVPIKADLEEIVDDNTNSIQRYEINQRSVIFYVDQIPNNRDGELRISFDVERQIRVGNIQPVAVKVYDYYNPSEQCTKFYHPSGGDPLLSTICEGDTCTCASSKCSQCDTRLEANELLEKSCDSSQTYVYHLEVVGREEEEAFDVINCTIVSPIKLGDDRNVTAGSSILFWISRKCECPKVRPGQQYLFIGKKYLPFVDKFGVTGYKYIIDEETTVEYWPTKTRRKTRQIIAKLQGVRDSIMSGRANCG